MRFLIAIILLIALLFVLPVDASAQCSGFGVRARIGERIQARRAEGRRLPRLRDVLPRVLFFRNDRG